MRFVLASANPGKIREMREILSEYDIDIISRSDLGIDLDVEETGSTFMENALIKARAISEAAGLPAIADDSGLVVDALDGQPGVYSSSYGGDELDSSQRYLYLLEKMKGMEQRTARFVCTIVCVFPDGDCISAQGECRGSITNAPAGTGGFGYDPVFLVCGKDKTMSELTPGEKNEVSHRGEALRKFVDLLRERGY